MRYTRVYNEIRVIGKIWVPCTTCAMAYRPSDHDVENMKNEEGSLTRELIERWISLHSGDFQSIEDFCADIAQGDNDVVFDWANEESEYTYLNCVYPQEELA